MKPAIFTERLPRSEKSVRWDRRLEENGIWAWGMYRDIGGRTHCTRVAVSAYEIRQTYNVRLLIAHRIRFARRHLREYIARRLQGEEEHGN